MAAKPALDTRLPFGRRSARSTVVALVATLLVTQFTLGVASADPSAPDGLIVYETTPRNGPGADVATDLWLTTTRSNTDRRLTSTPQSELTPAWAHDGRRIAFARIQEDANGVFVGSWLYAIDAYTGIETLLTAGGAFNQPAWSPGDTRLVFNGSLNGDPDNGINAHIFTMPSNGGAIQQLTSGAFADSGASWSPAGDLIAFTSNRAGLNQSEIWLMNADGSNQHAVPTGLSFAQAPDWSPDGQWLVFAGWVNNVTGPELYKVRPDGTQLTQLTSNSTVSMADPSWSPDGSTILFDGFAPRGTNTPYSSELMTVSANGGPIDLLRPGVRHLLGQLFPDWQPINP